MGGSATYLASKNLHLRLRHIHRWFSINQHWNNAYRSYLVQGNPRHRGSIGLHQQHRHLDRCGPRRELGLFLGINQIAFRAGALLGLTLSGLILSFLDWRALFYINIPIGIFGTLWARRQLKETALLDTNRRIDWIGFALFTAFLFCLMVGLTFGAYGTSGLTYCLRLTYWQRWFSSSFCWI